MTKAAATVSTSRAGSKRRLRLWLAIIVIFMAWAVYTVVNQLTHQDATNLRLAAIQQRIAEGEKTNTELTQKIARLQDPEYIQEVARKDQGMVMPGEQPIQVTGHGD